MSYRRDPSARRGWMDVATSTVSSRLPERLWNHSDIHFHILKRNYNKTSIVIYSTVMLSTFTWRSLLRRFNFRLVQWPVVLSFIQYSTAFIMLYIIVIIYAQKCIKLSYILIKYNKLFTNCNVNRDFCCGCRVAIKEQKQLVWTTLYIVGWWEKTSKHISTQVNCDPATSAISLSSMQRPAANLSSYPTISELLNTSSMSFSALSLPYFILFLKMLECRTVRHLVTPVPEWKKGRGRYQSGTRIRGPSPVPEGSGTGSPVQEWDFWCRIWSVFVLYCKWPYGHGALHTYVECINKQEKIFRKLRVQF